MKRLTNVQGLCIERINCIEESNCQQECDALEKCTMKLKEYEDLEENGLIIRIPCEFSNTHIDADIVNKSLEKAIAKEAIDKKGRYDFDRNLMYVTGMCPTCRCEISNTNNVYCNCCGQLIDTMKWFDGIPDTI